MLWRCTLCWRGVGYIKHRGSLVSLRERTPPTPLCKYPSNTRIQAVCPSSEPVLPMLEQKPRVRPTASRCSQFRSGRSEFKAWLSQLLTMWLWNSSLLSIKYTIPGYLAKVLRTTERCLVFQPTHRGTPVSRCSVSNAPSVKISAHCGSFVKRYQDEELFYAPVGLYQVLLCMSVNVNFCPILQLDLVRQTIMATRIGYKQNPRWVCVSRLVFL